MFLVYMRERIPSRISPLYITFYLYKPFLPISRYTIMFLCSYTLLSILFAYIGCYQLDFYKKIILFNLFVYIGCFKIDFYKKIVAGGLWPRWAISWERSAIGSFLIAIQLQLLQLDYSN